MKKTLLFLVFCSTFSATASEEFKPAQKSYNTISYVNADYDGMDGYGVAITVAEHYTGRLGYVFLSSIYKGDKSASVDGLTWKAKASSISASIGPSFYLTKNISIYGLVGLAIHRFDFNIANKYSEQINATSFNYGAGVNFAVNDKFSFNLGIENTTAKSSIHDDLKLDIRTVNLGIGYNF